MKETAKLCISIFVDVLGMASYIFPFAGDFLDVIYAFIQASWIGYAYRSVPFAILGFLEEGLPYTDIIPTSTIAHFYNQRKMKKIK